MSLDRSPIPPEALPPGWGAVETREGRFAYRHRRSPIELVADRATGDRSHPGLGLCRCWELRFRYPLADRSISRAIGRVSTRRAAVEGLLECMRRLHAYVDDSTDLIEVQSILEGVALGDFVPDGSS